MLDVPFIIYILLAVPFVLFGDVLRDSWGFRPDMALIFIVALAFSGRGRLAPLFGLILGLILDSMNPESTFTYALGYFVTGILVGYIRSRYLRRNLFIRCLTLIVLIEAFRLYLIVAAAFRYGVYMTPYFHPGLIAPGIFLSLLIFLPLTSILDRILPQAWWEERQGEVFTH
jgi:rod shape-determining protein MreD